MCSAETTERAETLHGRRREHADIGFLERAELLIERADNAHDARVARVAVRELVQLVERHRAARARVVRARGHARELHGTRHARCLHGQLAHGLGDFFRAIQRGRRRQLRHRDDVLLVLRTE